MCVDQQRFAGGSANLILREEEVERIVWIAASEISRAFKGPSGVDESKFHQAVRSKGTLELRDGAAIVPDGTKSSRLGFHQR